jgi:uncharacterized membrane protein
VSDRQRLITRVGLAYLTLGAAGVALWATFAPRSWYEDFPGAGKTWVSVDGPYNEHLIRDVGAFELGLLVLGAAAIIIMSRDLVRVALIAFFVSGLPHAIYHLRHPDPGGNGDPAGVATVVALPLAALVLLILTERWQQPGQRRDGTPRPAQARTAPGG